MLERESISGNGWRTYTPVFTASAGALTSTVITEAKYVQIGKTVFVRLNFTITNKGTASGVLYASLPVPALDDSNAGCGAEIVAVGYSLRIRTADTTKIEIVYYNGAGCIADNNQFVIDLVYEAP
jgi:hypothetical protein